MTREPHIITRSSILNFASWKLLRIVPGEYKPGQGLLSNPQQSAKGIYSPRWESFPELIMDAATVTAISATVVNLLSTFFRNAGESAAKKGGEEVVDAIKKRLAAHSGAKEAVTD